MKINIKGVIVQNRDKELYNWFGIDAVSPRDVITALDEAKGQDIEVDISSGGGDVYAGSEIYSALKSYAGNSVGNIVGIAGSAASVIAMGVKKLKISPTAMIMIHNAQTVTVGDSNAHASMSETLKTVNTSIRNAYKLKTKKTDEELINLMNNTTWFDAKTALENGFVDEIMFDSELKLSASVFNGEIPPQILDKMRNFLAEKINKDPDPEPKPKLEDPPQENDNGAETQPTTDTQYEAMMQAQRKEIARLKNKLYGGMLT
jgi:ATP-dependent protease ClpP protease subunit